MLCRTDDGARLEASELLLRPALGFNPMRWDCKRDGCFNLKRRPKIEVFAECFPRRINFGDVDGLVELNGHFGMLEWKGKGGSVTGGQRRCYVEFTRRKGNIVFVVDGNAETMEISAYGFFWLGKFCQSRPANLQTLKDRIKGWARWADSVRRVYP